MHAPGRDRRHDAGREQFPQTVQRPRPGLGGKDGPLSDETRRLPGSVGRQKVVIAAPSGAAPVVTVPMTRLVAVLITDTMVEPLSVT
jgi:hypothetical protein